eukprot:TRINITY_DN13417_c0_g1_i8.p1 TRINITY_DN13417_c0_g1~~TRINITY_DN13417_c0_g1_i8.p1  ORF type:complete len:203 (+),score=-16.64 TRINITY_DN13417_c0_g1_i8:200-808(+)
MNYMINTKFAILFTLIFNFQLLILDTVELTNYWYMQGTRLGTWRVNFNCCFQLNLQGWNQGFFTLFLIYISFQYKMYNIVTLISNRILVCFVLFVYCPIVSTLFHKTAQRREFSHQTSNNLHNQYQICYITYAFFQYPIVLFIQYTIDLINYWYITCNFQQLFSMKLMCLQLQCVLKWSKSTEGLKQQFVWVIPVQYQFGDY